MKPDPFRSERPVTLVGGGPVVPATFERARCLAPVIVAADGGADAALTLGAVPDAVIGDMDSISDAARARIGADRLHPVAEQESTDFDKCLRSIAAPFVIAVGFDGSRMDHALAAFNTLVRNPAQRCILLGVQDAAFLAPAGRTVLHLSPGTRLSLFPIGPVTGRSRGLRWPIDGIGFAPDGRIGTSNLVTEARVTLDFSAAKMVAIVPAADLEAAVSAVARG